MAFQGIGKDLILRSEVREGFTQYTHGLKHREWNERRSSYVPKHWERDNDCLDHLESLNMVLK